MAHDANFPAASEPPVAFLKKYSLRQLLEGLDAHPSQNRGRVGHPEKIKASNRRTG
jgi:hypothetical protein